MKTLARAVASPDAVGTPVPTPFVALNRLVSLRTKELVMVAGAPGGGKSTLAANMAVGMDAPLLYCAQDSPGSVLSRMTALSLGRETNQIQNALVDAERRSEIAEQMDGRRPTLIFNRGAVTVERLHDMCVASEEWLGMPPPVIVIDNLIDLIVGGHSYHETTFYAVALSELKRLSQEMDTCIVVLHHVTRGGGAGHGRGNEPLRLTDLLYAGEREARHVWGVYNDGEGEITVQVLKQQDGRADPSGGLRVPLRWYPTLGKLASIE